MSTNTAPLGGAHYERLRRFAFSIARRSGRSTLRSSEWNTWREHILGETPKPTAGVMLLGCGSTTKNCQGEKGDQNTEQRTRDGQTKRKRSSRLAGSISVLIVCCCLHGTEPAPKASSITRNSNSCAVWLCLHAMYFKHRKVDISENATSPASRK